VGGLLLGVLAGCTPSPQPASELAGALLPNALPRPDFTLRTVAGEPFPFAERTRGRLTLLFFGYTNCPDVCPATMSNLGAVLDGLTSAERQRIDVVFVTTDPERDDPLRVADWLAGFDREFIGLTGSIAELESAQRAAGIAPAIRDSASGARIAGAARTPSASGTADYQVSHAAQVLVYSPDDSAHVAYPFGTRQQQWAADLPVLLRKWLPRGSPR
jgi:protein SCO1/2